MTRSLLCLALGLSLLASSCGQQADEARPAADTDTDTATTPATPAPAPEGEVVDASYLCEGGNRVDLILDGRSARVSMVDGRVVNLGIIENSSPRTWSDVGLSFVVDGDYIALSENDRGLSLRCEPAGE